MNDDLRSFVRDALARGLPRTAIRERLLEAGWRPEEVETALRAFAEADFPVPVPRRRPYLSAREAFLYLVLFVTLYIVAFNTGLVLFAVLDLRLTDAADGASAARGAVVAMRNGIAALVIGFPIFLWVSALVGRALAREPENRGSKIRKWLTYVTLFLAALVLIGDLTFVVQRLLSGELPLRTLLKAVVVLAIAGTVFGHYLADLRGEEREGAPARGWPWLARAGAVAVIVTVGLGLFSMDSPRRARQRALDARRVGDLQAIESALEGEWTAGRELPATLDQLAARGTVRGLRGLRDPQSGVPYGYAVLDSAKVELCATFVLEDSLADSGREPAGAWRHPAGRKCFTVDFHARGLSRAARLPEKLGAAPYGGD
jgi:hypothetical protein